MCVVQANKRLCQCIDDDDDDVVDDKSVALANKKNYIYFYRICVECICKTNKQIWRLTK